MRYPVERFSVKCGVVLFLNGFGQIMFQQSALTGIFFFIGICTNSWFMASGGILGALSGVITARFLAFKSDDILQGVYGFNGALVGIALIFSYAPGAPSYLLILLGGAISSVLMNVMLRWRDHLPPLTAPFILSAWIMLLIAHLSGIEPASYSTVPVYRGDVFAVFRGLGQVMFQDSWIAGIAFSIGLVLHSRHAAAWALIGSAVGLVAARSLGYPETLVQTGIFSFNGVLTGIALGDKFRDNAMMPIVGVVLSVVIIRGFQSTSIPALTAPFVLSTWVIILVNKFGILLHRTSPTHLR